MRSSESWRLILTLIASATAAFAVTFGALDLLNMMRSRPGNAGAPVTVRLGAGGMEDVILAASQRLSDKADDKLSLARPTNEKRFQDEQLLKQLKAWMDKDANR